MTTLKERFEEQEWEEYMPPSMRKEVLDFIKSELEALVEEVESYDPKEYAREAQEGFSAAATIIRNKIKELEV